MASAYYSTDISPYTCKPVRIESLKDLAHVFSHLGVIGPFSAYFRSNTESPNTSHFCQSVPDLQRMESELTQSANSSSV